MIVTVTAKLIIVRRRVRPSLERCLKPCILTSHQIRSNHRSAAHIFAAVFADNQRTRTENNVLSMRKSPCLMCWTLLDKRSTARCGSSTCVPVSRRYLSQIRSEIPVLLLTSRRGILASLLDHLALVFRRSFDVPPTDFESQR